MAQPDLVGSCGRLHKPDLETRRVSAFAVRGDAPHLTSTRYLEKIAKLHRQVLELKSKLVHVSLLRRVECQKPWQAICRNGPNLFDSSWNVWWTRPLPDCEELTILSEAIETYHLQTAQFDADDRVHAFKNRMRQGWKAGGAEAYRAVKELRQPTLKSVRNGDHMCTDISSILDALQESWGALWSKSDLCGWEAFERRYGGYLQHHACDVPVITGTLLKDLLASRSNERAVAACSTRVAEMRDLPVCLLEIPAAVYSDIEQGGAWPRVLCLGIVRCLPKGQACPEDEDLTSILAPLPEDTRPITNLSPWKSLYSSCEGMLAPGLYAWGPQWSWHPRC